MRMCLLHARCTDFVQAHAIIKKQTCSGETPFQSHTCSAGPSCSLPREATSCPGVAASGEAARADRMPGATTRLGLLAGRGPTFR